MTTWMYRWPNGEVSIVFARNKIEAIELLDEWGDANPKRLAPVPPGAIDLRLNDEGGLDLARITECLDNRIWECFPDLYKALNLDGNPEAGKEEIAAAVKREREREWDRDEDDDAKTEGGRLIQKHLRCSGALADKWSADGDRTRVELDHADLVGPNLSDK